MLTAPIAFAISSVSAAVLTPVVRAFAVRRGLLDRAEAQRKIHRRPVPRLGGVAIVAAFYVPLLGLLLVQSSVGTLLRAEPLEVVGLFAGGLAIAALGFYDDLRGANATDPPFGSRTIVIPSPGRVGIRAPPGPAGASPTRRSGPGTCR